MPAGSSRTEMIALAPTEYHGFDVGIPLFRVPLARGPHVVAFRCADRWSTEVGVFPGASIMTIQAVVPWRCHICKTESSEAYGGLCAACHRPTCSACWADHRGLLPGGRRTRRCKTCATLKQVD
jgi:hypothetical protein